MRWLALALLLTAIGAAPARAQDADQPYHRGFWIGFGLGAGANLTEGYGDARMGGSAYLRLGGTINPLLLVGGEAIVWAKEVSGSTITQGNATATVLFYPMREGLHLKSGLGFATWSQAFSSGNRTTTTTEGGFGATFGAGYDIRLGTVSFTPNVDLMVQVIKSDTFTSNTGYLALFTLGLTWH